MSYQDIYNKTNKKINKQAHIKKLSGSIELVKYASDTAKTSIQTQKQKSDITAPFSGNIAKGRKQQLKDFLLTLGFKQQGTPTGNKSSYVLQVPYSKLNENMFGGAVDKGAAARKQWEITMKNRAKLLGVPYSPNKFYPIAYQKIYGLPTGTDRKVLTKGIDDTKPQPNPVSFKLLDLQKDKTGFSKNIKGAAYPQSWMLGQELESEQKKNLFDLFQSVPDLRGFLSIQGKIPTTYEQLAHALTPGVTHKSMYKQNIESVPYTEYRALPAEVAADGRQLKGLANNTGVVIRTLEDLSSWLQKQKIMTRDKDAPGMFMLNPDFDNSDLPLGDERMHFIINNLNQLNQLRKIKNRTEQQNIRLHKLEKDMELMLLYANNGKASYSTAAV